MVGIGWGLIALAGVALVAGIVLMVRATMAVRTRGLGDREATTVDFPFKDLVALLGTFGKVLADPAATPEQRMLVAGAFLVVVSLTLAGLAVVLLVFAAALPGH